MREPTIQRVNNNLKITDKLITGNVKRTKKHLAFEISSNWRQVNLKQCHVSFTMST